MSAAVPACPPPPSPFRLSASEGVSDITRVAAPRRAPCSTRRSPRRNDGLTRNQVRSQWSMVSVIDGLWEWGWAGATTAINAASATRPEHRRLCFVARPAVRCRIQFRYTCCAAVSWVGREPPPPPPPACRRSNLHAAPMVTAARLMPPTRRSRQARQHHRRLHSQVDQAGTGE